MVGEDAIEAAAEAVDARSLGRARLTLALCGVLLLGCAALLAAVLALDGHDLASWFRGLGAARVPALLAATALLVVAMLPAAGAAAGCGYVLGTAPGFLVAMAGLGLSSLLAAALSRRAARGHGAQALGARSARAAAWVGDRPFRSVVIARITPGTPFNAISYVLGLTEIPLRTIAIASVVGFAPRALIYTAAGTSLHDLTSPEAKLAWGATAALALAALATGPIQARRRGRVTQREV